MTKLQKLTEAAEINGWAKEVAPNRIIFTKPGAFHRQPRVITLHIEGGKVAKIATQTTDIKTTKTALLVLSLG